MRHTKHDGLTHDPQLYAWTLCLKCGGHVVYLPAPQCKVHGILSGYEMISVREDYVPEVREAIRDISRRLESFHLPTIAEHRETVITSQA